jgi:Flp pilus assembly protein TadG
VLRNRRDDKGTAMVEFALCLPFLAIFALGTLDLGRVYQTYSAVKNSARAAALYAQYHPGAVANSAACASPANIPWQGQHEGSSGAAFTIAVTDVTTGTAQTVCDTTTSLSGHQIKVTVTKSAFPLLTPLISNMVGTLNISSSVSVRAQ